MSKPINHSLIGIFVLGALALLVGSIIAFSSLTFNKKSTPLIVYLTDSLNGLSLNSDVKFKGVKIGKVQKILLNIQDNAQSIRSIPVIIEIDDHFVKNADTAEMVRHRMSESIQQGLRARIQQSNLLTGMLYIELDYFPGTPAILRGNGESEYLEIPTIPSNMSQMLNSVAQILQNLSQVDFKSFSERLKETANTLNAGVSAIEFEKINANILQASEAAKKLLDDPQLAQILKNVNRATLDISALSRKLETHFDPLRTDFESTTEALRNSLEQINKTMLVFRSSLMGTHGSLEQELSETLEQIDDAARSIRTLSDYLRQHPDAVIFGNEDQP